MSKIGVAKFVMTSFSLHDFPALALQARQKLLTVPLQYQSRFRGHIYTHMQSANQDISVYYDTHETYGPND